MEFFDQRNNSREYKLFGRTKNYFKQNILLVRRIKLNFEWPFPKACVCMSLFDAKANIETRAEDEKKSSTNLNYTTFT